MAMNSVALLQAVLDKALADRDIAAAELRAAERLVLAAQTQASSLQTYRVDYDQRWVSRFRASGGPELLHCHRSFGQRLDQAIALQTSNAQQLGNRLHLARQTALAREQRVAAVRKLMERRQIELQKLNASRDQRNTDEAAQRAHSQRLSQP